VGEVDAITLGEIVEKYGIGGGAVLKMGCGGCEYDVILNDYERVKLFDEVLFEHHAYVTDPRAGFAREAFGRFRVRDREQRGALHEAWPWQGAARQCQLRQEATMRCNLCVSCVIAPVEE